MGNYIWSNYFFPYQNDHYTWLFPGYDSPFTNKDWQNEKIINQNFKAEKDPVTLLVLVNHANLNHSILNYYANIYHKDIKIVQHHEFYNPLSLDDPEYENLENFDFILTKSSGDYGLFVNPVVQQKINNHLESTNNFMLVSKYNLPDESQALIYKKNTG